MNLNVSFSKEEKFVSTNLPLLKPWAVYPVTFEGCEFTTFQGKKDPTASYEVLKFKFKGEKGQYTETLFAPKPGNEKRGERENSNGHKIPTPSLLDNFKYELGQLLQFINPQALEKMCGLSLTFEKLADFVVKATEKSKGKQLYIKLIGNKQNKPRFPYFLNFFEGQNEPVVTNNFISDDANALGLTDYELSQKEKIEKAKPTDMASVSDGSSTDLDAVPTDNSDLDLDMSEDLADL